ncbi:MAG: DUF3488 and transglutaminase-like domain-containing protein [Planctomycetota bacterium]
MSLARLHEYLVLSLVAWSALLFSVSDERPHMFFVALAFVVVGGVLNTGPRPHPLPRYVVNALLIAASAWTGLEAVATFRTDRQELVSVIAWYLLALQVLKLFEPATLRDRATTVLLSTMLGLSSTLVSVDLRTAMGLLVMLPLLLFTRQVQQILDASRTEGGRTDPALRLPRGLRSTTLALTLMSLGVGVAVFILMPRGFTPRVNMIGGGSSSEPQVGYSDTVALGQSGLLSSDPRLVMTVKMLGEPRPFDGALAIRVRGAALERYDASTGAWIADPVLADARTRIKASSQRFTVPAPARARSARVTLLDGPVERLFTIWQPTRLYDLGTRAQWKYRTDTLSARMDQPISGPLSYNIDFARPFARTESASDRAGLLEPIAPFDAHPVRDIALRVLDEQRVSLDDPDSPGIRDRVIDAFEAHLRGYAYTTELRSPPSGMDPIEAFLEEFREGHCEYFAGSFVALCQSVGLPARVVTGFLVSEYEPESQTYFVRQSNAHAWAEVEVTPGLWMTVDTSPPEDIERVHRPPHPLVATMRRTRDRVENWWANWVIGYDSRRQLEALGETGRSIQQIDDNVRDAMQDAARARQQGEPVLPRILTTLGRAVGAAAGAVAGVLIIVWLLRVVPRRRIRSVPRTAGPSGALRRRVRRFDRLLARAGHARPAWRPKRAHADAIALRSPALGAHAVSFARAYDALRFAGRTPSPEDLAGLDRALDALRAASKEAS